MSTAVADLQNARSDALRLIEIEASRTGMPADLARDRIAGREGIGTGTVRNIVKGRVKAVAGWVRDRLRAAVIRELQNEILRLEHELQMARLGADRPSDDEVAAAAAALATAKRFLGGSVR
jgi:hypothetical protein